MVKLLTLGTQSTYQLGYIVDFGAIHIKYVVKDHKKDCSIEKKWNSRPDLNVKRQDKVFSDPLTKGGIFKVA